MTAPSHGRAPSTEPITVLGSATCEDTAITRSRLDALDVPFEDVDVDVDRGAADRIVRLNGGRRITPTVVVGSERLVVAEPTLERVGELVREAGHERAAPTAVQLHGDVTSRAVPLRNVARAADGSSFSLGGLRRRSQAALFLGHDAGCLACFGYARQLVATASALHDADGTSVIVASGPPEAARAWQHGLPDGSCLIADDHGVWKRAIAESVGLPADRAILVLLDRFLAPRVVSSAEEAGGLIDPSDAVGWLRFVALDCPECAGEIEWADQIDWTRESAPAD